MSASLRLADGGEQLLTDLDSLSEMVDDSQPGWSRVALTELDREGRHWVRRRMIESGLKAHIDEAGNVIGVLPGRDPSAGTIMTGSHTDTVPTGGKFDGNVGVAAALDVVRSLRAQGIQLAQDLMVVDFFSEEPNRFGLSCVGSRAMTGRLNADHLLARDASGARFGDALVHAGIDPSTIMRARMDLTNVIAYVELHIEQGPNLEEQDTPIGLVTSITGISRFRGLFRGRMDHAGTMPMSRRHDAGCAAAGTVLAVESIASDSETSRGTTGRLTFTPDAVNVVSETAEVFGEFRSPDPEWLSYARGELLDAAQEHGERRGVSVDIEWLSQEAPVPMSDRLTQIASDALADLELPYTRMYSGAEHDAAMIAHAVPSMMIFVPSRAGRSHCPEEFTDSADILRGAEALLNTIVGVSVRAG